MGGAIAQGLAYGLTGAALVSYAFGVLEARTILATLLRPARGGNQVSLSREQIERIVERVNEDLDPDKEFDAVEVARRARGK